MARPRTRPGSERGAAAVEFALVVPLLVLLIVGIADVSRAFQAQSTLAQAAREGARVMAVQNNQAAARSAVLAATASLPTPLTASQIIITPTICTRTAGNATVTLRYRSTVLAGTFGAGVDLTGRGVMRCSG